jgi:pyruvate/2-oxoacid:ferredoxin oxidoreductase alpha subunit
MSIDQSKFKAEPVNRGDLVSSFEKGGGDEVDGGFNYKRYSFTESGISPYTIPGTENGEFIASSYEHDEY